MVVVDNAHELTVPATERLLDTLGIVPLLRLVVAGRDLRAFTDGRTRARFQHAEISPAELSFTLEETSLMLAAAGLGAHEAAASLLHSISGGDAAVLGAAMVELPRSPFMVAADTVDRVTALVSRLAVPQGVVDGSDPLYRQFLFDMAVVDVFEPGLAAELSGSDQARQYLDRAARDGIGIWLDDHRFAYAGATRLALRGAAIEADAERVGDLAGRCAQLLAASGQQVLGFRVALENGRYRAAETAARDGLVELLLGHRAATQALLESVPGNELVRYPLLAWLLGLLCHATPERRPKARELFEAAVAAARRRLCDNPADHLMDRAVEAICLRSLRRLDQCVEPARAVLELVSRSGVDERSGVAQVMPVMVAHSSLALLYAGCHEEGLAGLGLGHAEARPATLGRLLGLSMAAGSQALLGRMGAATELIDLVRSSRWAAPLVDVGSAYYHMAEALTSIERMEPEGAISAVRRAAAVERFTDTHWELLAYVEALAELFAGRPLHAVELIDAERQLHAECDGPEPFHPGLLTAMRATAQLAAGRPGAALATLDAAPPDAVPVLLARARISLATDLVPDALGALRRAELAGGMTPRQRAEYLALRAAARLRLAEDHQSDVAELAAALELFGLRTPLALLPDADIGAIGERSGRAFQASDGRPITSALAPASIVRLSPRESVVLGKLVETGSAAEIAADLYISMWTVKAHLRNVYRKLGVHSREEALAIAPRVVPTAVRHQQPSGRDGGVSRR